MTGRTLNRLYAVVCVPTYQEAVFSPGEAADPLGEKDDMKAPGLVHRYPDRVLLLATNSCSTLCRYCTRHRLISCGHDEGRYNKRNLEKALAYIRRHTEIRDVLISGGDPLTLPDERLEWIVRQVRSIDHVELIRIGSKVPAVLPQRVTPDLVNMLRQYHPLFISLHFTHPDELTPESGRACTRLADAGIPLGSQTVLLAGVNDSVETLKRLFQGLLKFRVRPYLSVSVRSHSWIGAFQDSGFSRFGNHERLARPYHRVRRADLCGGCTGRRR